MFANKSHAQAFELCLKNDFKAALDLYDQAIIQTPGHPDLLSDRAFCLLRRGKNNECIHDLNEALKIQPGYAYRYSSLGFIYHVTGDNQNAKKNYQQALELDPKETIAVHNIGFTDSPSVTPLINPENIRKKILKTYIEFTRQFPNTEDQKKLIQFLRNQAK
jgi:tetratricopeptide (TPR) repeat protein